jgi:GNAT superfamily N-acetyltransferase
VGSVRVVGIEITVRPHRRDEVGTLVAVAARAFWDDPLFNFFLPDLLTQHRSVGFFQAGIEDCARHGQLSVAEIDGRLAGVAAWLPPGVHVATSGRRAAAQGRRVAGVLARTPHRRDALALLNEMPRRHLRDEHWYLQLLSTDPAWQGRGVGTALLEPVLARCDREGFPAYLETQKESNLAYYRRFGFEVTDEIRVRTAPPVWTMTRPSR